MYTAHPRCVAPQRTASSPGVGPRYEIRCSELAELIGASQRLYERFLSIAPRLSIVFARGALPINFSLLYRLEADGKTEFLSDGEGDGDTFHIFPGLVNNTWHTMGNHSIKFFEDEMTEIFLRIRTDPIKIFVVDTTRTGNSLNVELNTFNRLARKLSRRLEVYFEPIICAKTNVPQQAQTWKVDGLNVIVPKILKKYGDYATIDGKHIQIFDYLSTSIHFNIVTHLFTEDKKEFLCGEIMRGWPILNPIRDSGQIRYVSDSGAEPASSSALDSTGYNLPFYLAEKGPFKKADWEMLSKQTETGPISPEYLADMCVQFLRDDTEYETMLYNQEEPLREAQIDFLGAKGQDSRCIAKLFQQLLTLTGDENKESALKYLRRVRPDLAPQECAGDIDLKLKWWHDALYI